MMLPTPRLRLLAPALFLLALVSCRSQQAAFRFSAADSRAVAAGPVAAPVPRVAPATTMAPATALPAAHQTTSVNKPAPRLRHRQTQAALRQLVRPTQHRATAAARRRPQDEGEGNPWLLVLGVALVAAAIVGGILIGGGVGIFVGLAVGVFGYYFLAKGILGPNAWLEIGQELFQM